MKVSSGTGPVRLVREAEPRHGDLGRQREVGFGSASNRRPPSGLTQAGQMTGLHGQEGFGNGLPNRLGRNLETEIGNNSLLFP